MSHFMSDDHKDFNILNVKSYRGQVMIEIN